MPDFHLHLTDDQLFSWPSRAFPKLSGERAGWTVDDFMALEAYSQARGVTIIPELDVSSNPCFDFLAGQNGSINP